MTQAEMAELMGYSTGYYSKLERGERKISLEHLSQISDLLEVPLQVRLGQEKDSTTAEMNQAFRQMTAGYDEEEVELLIDFCQPTLHLIRKAREKELR